MTRENDACSSSYQLVLVRTSWYIVFANMSNVPTGTAGTYQETGWCRIAALLTLWRTGSPVFSRGSQIPVTRYPL